MTDFNLFNVVVYGKVDIIKVVIALHLLSYHLRFGLLYKKDLKYFRRSMVHTLLISVITYFIHLLTTEYVLYFPLMKHFELCYSSDIFAFLHKGY